MTSTQFRGGLTFYAVWEYYSTLYVYSEGSWHLCVPMVRVNGKWIESIASGYVPDGEDYKWKL